MTVGEFLGKMIERIWDFWPLRIVTQWEQGVRVTLGHAEGPLTATNGFWGTGLHAFWPGAGMLLTEETNIEVSETPTQTVTTADGEALTFALAVSFHITDLCRLYLNVHDYQDALPTQMQAAAGEIAGQLYWDPEGEEQPSVELLPEMTKKRLDEQFTRWGVEILEISPTNVSVSPTLRLISDLSAPA